jgi:hypothetical protein
MSADNQAGKVALSFRDIMGGGDNPYKEIEVPGITMDGKPGVVYLKHPSAGDILRFADNASDTVDQAKNNEAMLDMITKCIVDKSGSPLLSSKDEVKQLPLPVFTCFVTAINSLSGAAQKEALGKGSEEVVGGSSPTN